MTSDSGTSLTKDNGRKTTSDSNVRPITENFKRQTASDMLLNMNFTMMEEQMF